MFGRTKLKTKEKFPGSDKTWIDIENVFLSIILSAILCCPRRKHLQNRYFKEQLLLTAFSLSGWLYLASCVTFSTEQTSAESFVALLPTTSFSAGKFYRQPGLCKNRDNNDIRIIKSICKLRNDSNLVHCIMFSCSEIFGVFCCWLNSGPVQNSYRQVKLKSKLGILLLSPEISLKNKLSNLPYTVRDLLWSDMGEWYSQIQMRTATT